MTKDTLLIKNPSEKLLNVVRSMRDTKEKDKSELLLKKDLYFNKK